MTFWAATAADIDRRLDFRTLPTYAFRFVFRELGAFRTPFVILTSVSFLSYLLRFGTVYLLSFVISHIDTLTWAEISTQYAPLWIAALVVAEGLDYATRRFSEAFPQRFTDVTRLRAYRSLLRESFHRAQNYSKEKLELLIERYLSHVSVFLHDWFWSITGKLTRLAIILVVLGNQSIVVLGANLLYIAIFLAIAFTFSTRYAPISRAYTNANIEASAMIRNFVLNANFLKRMALHEFFSAASASRVARSWDALDAVRQFHAKRWYVQLNLFNLMYCGTLLYGVHQVQLKELPLGYLLLIKWSFDELWQILVFAIENYVTLVQQRTDSELCRGELCEIFGERPIQSSESAAAWPRDWRRLSLTSAHVEFSSPELERTVIIRVDDLTIRRGEKIGIIGPSGSGKSTVLAMLARQTPFAGRLTIDDTPVNGHEFASSDVTLVTPHDPLFRISVRENILLGRTLSEPDLVGILTDTKIDFLPDLDVTVGDPAVHFSTGQLQRIRLARALVNPGKILLLDEPFTGLDGATRHAILSAMTARLIDQTVALVTHQEDELAMVSRTFSLESGRLQELS